MQRKVPVKQIPTQRRMFTPQEDALIVYLVNHYGNKDWRLIAKSLPNRTTRQVRERFKNFLSPELENGPWSREDDDLLKKLYAEYGPKWSKIAACFKNRSEVNIKNRWTSITKVNKYATPSQGNIQKVQTQQQMFQQPQIQQSMPVQRVQQQPDEFEKSIKLMFDPSTDIFSCYANDWMLENDI